MSQWRFQVAKILAASLRWKKRQKYILQRRFFCVCTYWNILNTWMQGLPSAVWYYLIYLQNFTLLEISTRFCRGLKVQRCRNVPEVFVRCWTSSHCLHQWPFGPQIAGCVFMVLSLEYPVGATVISKDHNQNGERWTEHMLVMIKILAPFCLGYGGHKFLISGGTSRSCFSAHSAHQKVIHLLHVGAMSNP